MFEAFVNFLSVPDVCLTYAKLAVLLYAVFYVIEEVLGKYHRDQPQL